MIIFVDFEHADRYKTPEGDKILAARTRITYRLEDLSGQHCMLVRYDRITPELLELVGATALFISGNSIDIENYDETALTPLIEIVRTTDLPMFGFCGGFQLISHALGSPVVPLGLPDDTAESETVKKGPGGRFFEFGYFPIDTEGTHLLLDGWTDAPTFRHAHGLHVPQPPAGFEVYGSTDVTAVQIAINDERRVIGTQFHPEYWTDEHPAGKTLIENFLRWADLV